MVEVTLEEFLETIKTSSRELVTDDLSNEDIDNRISFEKLLSIKQLYSHKEKMFVLVMVIVVLSFLVISLIILGQAFKIEFSYHFSFMPINIKVNELSDLKLTAIIGGFFAEILLLPQIILRSLYNIHATYNDKSEKISSN